MRKLLILTLVSGASIASAAPTKTLGHFGSPTAMPGTVTLHPGPQQHEYRVTMPKAMPYTRASLQFSFGHSHRSYERHIASDVFLHTDVKEVGKHAIARFFVPADFIATNRSPGNVPRLELSLGGAGSAGYTLARAH